MISEALKHETKMLMCKVKLSPEMKEVLTKNVSVCSHVWDDGNVTLCQPRHFIHCDANKHVIHHEVQDLNKILTKNNVGMDV